MSNGLDEPDGATPLDLALCEHGDHFHLEIDGLIPACDESAQQAQLVERSHSQSNSVHRPIALDEIEGLRFAHITTIGELDQLEQANIVEGMQWLKKQRNADILSEGFVRDLHKRLFGQVWKWAGTPEKLAPW
jgi:hypothetical protein